MTLEEWRVFAFRSRRPGSLKSTRPVHCVGRQVAVLPDCPAMHPETELTIESPPSELAKPERRARVDGGPCIVRAGYQPVVD
jgi:hypothetical protein